MPATPTSSRSVAATPCVAPRRRHARWWLAGLLVGCLLPAGLAQAEGLRHAERIVQACILAPALIRARSRLQARRRALVRWPSLHRHGPEHPREEAPAVVAPPRRVTADHDVLSRRGPPLVWAA